MCFQVPKNFKVPGKFKVAHLPVAPPDDGCLGGGRGGPQPKKEFRSTRLDPAFISQMLVLSVPGST